MPAIKDRVKQTTTTTGTGAVALTGTVQGFQTFAQAFGGNAQVYYCIADGTDWEIGIGSFTAGSGTLSRDTVLDSSNSKAAVNWGVGTKDVFVTLPAASLAQIGGQLFLAFVTKSAAFTLAASDARTLFTLNPGAGAVTIPAANTVSAGYMVGFSNNTGGTVVLSGASISGASSWGIGPNSFCNLYSDGSSWVAQGGGAMSIYAWDPSLRNSMNLTNSNLTAWRAGYDGGAGSVVANIYKGGTGKFYWEAKAYGDFGTKECGPYLGLSAVGNGASFQGQSAAVYCRVRQSILSTNQWSQGEVGRGNVYPNDVWGFAWDAPAGLMWVAINNAWIVSGNPALGSNALFNGIATNTQWRPACGIYNGGGDGADKYVYVDLRLSAGQWSYAPPPGFSAMI